MKLFAALALAAVIGGAGPALAASPSDAEAILRATITDIQAGTPNYDDMIPPLADAVKQNESGRAQLTSFGPVTSVVATTQADPYAYTVTFQNGVVLTWTLSFDAGGKIQGLQVQ